MIGLEARRQVLQHVAAVLPAGRYHAQRPLDESAPPLAIRTSTDPSPDHRKTQRSLRRVVRRLDPFDLRERPQSLFYLEDLEASRRRLRAPALRSFQEGLANLAAQTCHPFAERLPVQRPVSHPVPVVEQAMGQLQQLLADRFPLTPAIDHRLEIAAKVSPTNLSPPRRDPLISAEPIAADDLIGSASQQGFGDLARAVAGDGEDRSDPG